MRIAGKRVLEDVADLVVAESEDEVAAEERESPELAS
jgi:hypothetical protein